MAQSKRMSLLEAVTDTTVSFLLSLALNYYALPYLIGLHPNIWQSIGMTLLFSIVSIIRGYYRRRFFEWWGGIRIEFAALGKGS
jgi:hypothetical protein